MKKKQKQTKPLTARCRSTASGGALACVLELDHAGVHSTSSQGRRAPQYATWSIGLPGEVRVVTYQRGSKMSEWTEDAPAPAKDQKLADVGYCGVKFKSDGKIAMVDTCTLSANHIGLHQNTSTGMKEIDIDPRPLPSDFPVEDEEGDDPLEDEVRSDADRDLAREQREAREAHARELEAQAETKPASLTDACPKCGLELGKHDGKKCPKPEKKAAAKVRAHPAAWNCNCLGVDGAMSRHMMGDEGCQLHADGSLRKFRPLFPSPAAPLTKIGDHEVHPAAALFPMIGDVEWPSFVDDIRMNGQRKAIVRIGQLILDGRNRLRACLELAVEPKFRAFGEEASDGADPIAFVVSENIHRRHLNETQRAFVGAELVPMYEAQAKERKLGALKQNAGSVSPNSGSRETGKATEMAARAVNVGRSSIEAAIKVKRDAAPEVLAAAKDRGQIKVSTAAELSTLPKQKQREIVNKIGGGELRSGKVRSYVNQEKKREVVRTINEDRVAPAPLGPFGVIVIDPPWPYENSDQHEGSRGHLDYPTMSIHDLCELRGELDSRAKDDCILAMWVTNAFIHEVGRILFAWGFEHRTMITWDKEVAGVGMLPRGRTEHLVIATRGAPVHTLNEITTMLRVKKREHSRKPDEMYAILAKHCSGPMIDMFAREQREGFAIWGAEATKFATEAA